VKIELHERKKEKVSVADYPLIFPHPEYRFELQVQKKTSFIFYSNVRNKTICLKEWFYLLGHNAV
jgi:hypothetical protein